MSGSNLTSNINMLSPTGFKLTINREKFANIEYFVTSFGIPTVSSSEVQQDFRNTITYQPSETIQYDSLSLRFVIDEDMKNYTEIFDWIKRNSESKGERHDIILSVLSSHNNVNKQFQFRDAFPTSLGGVDFSTQLTDVEYLQADVTFRYNAFSIIK